MKKKIRLLRSLLFVPGNRAKMIETAIESKADALIIDLEDAVPVEEKASARKVIRERLNLCSRRKVYVRINSSSLEFIVEDINGLVSPNLDGVILPKAQSAVDVKRVAKILAKKEAEKGIKEGSLEIIPLIESARGIEFILKIADSHPRVKTVAFGAADFTLDMGIELTKEGKELFYARSRLVVACRAAGIESPIDSPYMLDIKDIEGLASEAKLARGLGFQGKLCIHPLQVEPVNRIFSPSPEEVTYAQRVLEAFKEAEAKGKGVISLNGKMIDYAFIKKAKRVIFLAKRKGC